jgi:hypothetical protein
MMRRISLLPGIVFHHYILSLKVPYLPSPIIPLLLGLGTDLSLFDSDPLNERLQVTLTPA